MLSFVLFLLGVSIAGFALTLLLFGAQEKQETRENETNIVDANLTEAPELCTWYSQELESGMVKFSLHTYGNLDGSTIFGSFVVNKNNPLNVLKRDLRTKSKHIVDAYNKQYIISNVNWDGPHQIER